MKWVITVLGFGARHTWSVEEDTEWNERTNWNRSIYGSPRQRGGRLYARIGFRVLKFRTFFIFILKTLVKPLRFGFESEERERERQRERERDGAEQWSTVVRKLFFYRRKGLFCFIYFNYYCFKLKEKKVRELISCWQLSSILEIWSN